MSKIFELLNGPNGHYYAAALLMLANSLFTAFRHRPQDMGTLGSVLGRFSFLRHGNVPGTLHLPGSAQPKPDALSLISKLDSRLTLVSPPKDLQ